MTSRSTLQKRIDLLPQFPQKHLEHLSCPNWRKVDKWIESIPENQLFHSSKKTFEPISLYLLEKN